MLLILAALAIIAGLVVGILYPEDPHNRTERIKRVAVTTATFASAFMLIDYGVGILVFGPSGGILTMGPAIVAAMLISVVPFSTAERVASLFRPRRVPIWAAIGVSACLAWSAALFFLSAWLADYSLPWLWAIVEIVVPGSLAGIVWYKLLPPRQPDLGRIFE